MTLASIPSPSTAVWHLGPLPIRAYALCIIAGIIVAAIIAEQRMRDRGAPQYAILDVAVWAVPFGIVGARIYNVGTSWQVYFGKDGTGWLSTLEIWKGGLGIWGAVAGGAVGAWIACRMLRIPLTMVADCLAPGLAVAQGLGRFGNWFNNELYGKATTLPWGLQVHEMDPDNPGHALIGPNGHPLLLGGLYQPTFLYEAIWDFGTALLVILMDRKYKFGKGRAFALYVMAYTVGRAWIEYLRVDPANHILGLRLNDWTAIIVFVGALIYFLLTKGPREYVVAEASGSYRTVTEEEFHKINDGGGTDIQASSSDSSDVSDDPDSSDGSDGHVSGDDVGSGGDEDADVSAGDVSAGDDDVKAESSEEPDSSEVDPDVPDKLDAAAEPSAPK